MLSLRLATVFILLAGSHLASAVGWYQPNPASHWARYQIGVSADLESLGSHFFLVRMSHRLAEQDPAAGVDPVAEPVLFAVTRRATDGRVKLLDVTGGEREGGYNPLAWFVWWHEGFFDQPITTLLFDTALPPGYQSVVIQPVTSAGIPLEGWTIEIPGSSDKPGTTKFGVSVRKLTLSCIRGLAGLGSLDARPEE